MQKEVVRPWLSGPFGGRSSVWNECLLWQVGAVVALSSHGARKRGVEGAKRGCKDELNSQHVFGMHAFRIGKMRVCGPAGWGPGPRPHLGSDRKRSVGVTMYSTGDPYLVKAPVTRGVTSASG
jgi:hypothetical protein